MDLPTLLKNRYHLVEQIGKGATSFVYRAFDQVLDREVAIKVLSVDANLAKDEVSARFLREGRAVAQLIHPNIVTLFDVDREDQWYYLVLEHVYGRDLQAVVVEHSGALPLDEALRIVQEILHGIAYAHQHGIIHRDMKPQNILMTENGHIKITDFGLALVQGDVRITESGAIVGTTLYLAPEMLADSHVDQRADLYSIGVVFYELLTGHTPYRADNFTGVISQILHSPIPDPRTANALIPEDVSAIIKKLLAKHPDERFPTAEAVLEALQALTSLSTLPPLETEYSPDLLVYTAREEMVLAIENERRRLAKLIEVNVLESVNLLLSQANMYEQSLATNPQARTVASVMASLARQAVQQVQEINTALHPVLLETMGFEPALEALVNQTLRTRGIQVSMLVERLQERLPKGLELALFRAAQDALERAVRYAHTSRVIVRLEPSAVQVLFSITHDGISTTGFDLLQTARQRIDQLGGKTETRLTLNGDFEFIIILPVEPPVQMTPRELEVLQLLAEGYTNKAIARALSISPRTVNFHLDNIYAKLGVNSRTEAAIYALRRGWINRPR